MSIEADIHAIEDLAVLKQDENWQFRVFLKGYQIPRKTMDAMVSDLYGTVSSAIDCTKCGNCCKKLGPVLDPKDIKRLCAGLKLSEEHFHDIYLTSDNEGDIIFKQTPCPFLKKECCSQYVLRPEVCRSYPHIHNSEFIHRLINIVQNISICPIVFNFYEGLKEKLREPFMQFEEEFLEDYFN